MKFWASAEANDSQRDHPSTSLRHSSPRISCPTSGSEAVGWDAADVDALESLDVIEPTGGTLVLDTPGVRVADTIIRGTVWVRAAGVQLERVLVSPRPGRRPGIRVGAGAHLEMSRSWILGPECDLDALWLEDGAHGALVRDVAIRGWGTHLRVQGGALMAQRLVSCGQSASAGPFDALVEVASDRQCRLEHCLFDGVHPDGSPSPAVAAQLGAGESGPAELVLHECRVKNVGWGFRWSNSGCRLRVEGVGLAEGIEPCHPASELKDVSEWDLRVEVPQMA